MFLIYYYNQLFELIELPTYYRFLYKILTYIIFFIVEKSSVL